MPENARVFIAEDDSDFRRGVTQLLARNGHVVVLEADCLTDALELITNQFVEANIQVAVLDTNLTPEKYSGADGIALVETIRKLYPDIKIVGCSSVRYPCDVDAEIIKKNVLNLPQAITDL